MHNIRHYHKRTAYSEALKNDAMHLIRIYWYCKLFPFIRFYEIFLNPLGFFFYYFHFLPRVSPMYNSSMYLEGWWPRYYNITYSVETINRPWWFWSPPRYERTKKKKTFYMKGIAYNKEWCSKTLLFNFWTLKKVQRNTYTRGAPIWPYSVSLSNN